MVGNLAQVLTGIAALKKGEMNAVKNAVKEIGGKRVFITNVKGTFFGMSESEEASKRR